jgi:hypothetical protein
MRTLSPVLLLFAILPLATGNPRRPAVTCATDAQRALGVFWGDFDVQVRYRTGPSTWDSSRATAQFTWDLDSCVLVEHFAGTRFGQPYRYLSVWGAAGDSVHPIQQFFVHSQHGLLSLSQGGWDPTGDTLIVED